MDWILTILFLGSQLAQNHTWFVLGLVIISKFILKVTVYYLAKDANRSDMAVFGLCQRCVRPYQLTTRIPV